MEDGRAPARVAPPLDVGDEGRPILGRKRGGESVGRRGRHGRCGACRDGRSERHGERHPTWRQCRDVASSRVGHGDQLSEFIFLG